MKDYKTIFNYMDSMVDEHIDHMTGELMLTELTEDAADHFGVDLDDLEYGDLYFPIAIDVEVKLLGNSFDNY